MARTGEPHHVVTVNPEFVMTARHSPAFAAVLDAADLALPDGIGILWAARLLGAPSAERVPGADLVPAVSGDLGAEGGGVFLLGAAPGVADAAGRRLESDFGARVVGTHVGSPREAEAAEIIRAVRSAAPRALFVAFGSPGQDLWIHRHRGALAVPLMMGVGGTLDFLAGAKRRAPVAVRRLGLEWLWRLGREPWRWRRQTALARFAGAVLAERFREGGRRDV
jgi:N-acetylglucosaminyldiphosphoundecaprenol N-acetyl-beta-D-mannosaminyltransferase